MVKIPICGNHFDRVTMHCHLNYINYVCMRACVYLGYLRVLTITVVMPSTCIQSMGAGSLNEGAYYIHQEQF